MTHIILNILHYYDYKINLQKGRGHTNDESLLMMQSVNVVIVELAT